jgi:hypothetical protein
MLSADDTKVTIRREDVEPYRIKGEMIDDASFVTKEVAGALPKKIGEAITISQAGNERELVEALTDIGLDRGFGLIVGPAAPFVTVPAKSIGNALAREQAARWNALLDAAIDSYSVRELENLSNGRLPRQEAPTWAATASTDSIFSEFGASAEAPRSHPSEDANTKAGVVTELGRSKALNDAVNEFSAK